MSDIRVVNGFLIQQIMGEYRLAFDLPPPAGSPLISKMDWRKLDFRLENLPEVLAWMRLHKCADAAATLRELLPHRAKDIDARIADHVECLLVGSREVAEMTAKGYRWDIAHQRWMKGKAP